MEITLEAIKELRQSTGAGFANVKEALEASKGDFEKAIIYLREKGMAKGAKRADKVASSGYVTSYIHGEGSIGVMLELNSETDFAARNEAFKTLAKEIALHVAASSPEYISIESIPAEIIQREKDIASKEIDTKKPKEIIEKILEGKLQKFYEDNVLLEQKYFKDEDRKVKDLIHDLVVAIGEKIEVTRFARFQVGKSAIYSIL